MRARRTRCWPAVGVGAEIPEVGDALPRDFAGEPLLLIRDRAGRVRVFQNARAIAA